MKKHTNWVKIKITFYLFVFWKMSKLARKTLIEIKVILGTVLVNCGEMRLSWIVTTMNMSYIKLTQLNYISINTSNFAIKFQLFFLFLFIHSFIFLGGGKGFLSETILVVQELIL